MGHELSAATLHALPLLRGDDPDGARSQRDVPSGRGAPLARPSPPKRTLSPPPRSVRASVLALLLLAPLTDVEAARPPAVRRKPATAALPRTLPRMLGEMM